MIIAVRNTNELNSGFRIPFEQGGPYVLRTLSPFRR